MDLESVHVDSKERRSIYASALQTTVEQLKGLPPALIIVSENDVLQGEGEAMFQYKQGGFRLHGLIPQHKALNRIANAN